MDNMGQWFQKILEINPELQTKVVSSVALIFILWIFRIVAMRILMRRTDDVRVRYRWRKTLSYITVMFGILIVGRVWFQGVQSIATFLGLLSAGLAIALKDIIADVAGWIFILWRRPFQVGDRIQIGKDAGDVIDISIFQFTLLEIGNWVDAEQSTGRMIHVPNSMVFAQPLANYSKGFEYIWDEVPVLVTFESNWRKAKDMLFHIVNDYLPHQDKTVEEQIRKASRQFLIFYSTLTPTVYTTVKDSGVMLTLRFICEPRRRRDTEQILWEKILDEFAKCDDIDLAYPTRRVYNNAVEGKPNAKASPIPQDKQNVSDQPG
jgi:small-conductance mechanosensitive channel